MHLYYNKTVGPIATPTVGPIVGPIATPTVGDAYVHLGGHMLRVPTGAVEQYNMQNEFTGYAMGGEFVNAADMIASAKMNHSYYDKMMTNVGVNAGQIGVKEG
jgi:hypothetical protein